MISINDIQNIIASSFFNDDMVLAGLVMFVVALMLIFVITKNVFQSLLIGMAVTMIFSYMGILSGDLMILLIIVCVLGLAMSAKKAVG